MLKACQDDEVFGYQEAWADYRYKPSRVSGEMRSQYVQSLDVWHLADDYSKMPALSDAWIHETPPLSTVSSLFLTISLTSFSAIFTCRTILLVICRCIPSPV